MRLSIIVPVLNEATVVGEALSALQPLRALGHEVIVVDGGSRDATRTLAFPLADQLLVAPRGRASQMNAGARQAYGETLVFLHADVHLPPDAAEKIVEAIRAGARWGYFDVRLTDRLIGLRVIEFFMNLRSRLTGIVTGDQAIFICREAFAAVGGYPPLPLMEDIAVSRQLGRIARPWCIASRVRVSARRWQQDGVVRTVLLMWWLRLAYFLGVHPARLAARYYSGHGERER